MKVLVTGGRGMVGGAIVRALGELRPNHEVFAPARGSIDLANPEDVAEMFATKRFDAVVHCAAKVGGIHANIAEPTAFLAENLRVDLNVIGAAHKHGVRSFLYFGSSCMYPRDRDTPLREEDLLTGELEPTNEGYAIAKLAGAKYCEYIGRQFGLAYRCLIPPNLYGRGDHFETNRSHLIAACIAKLVRASRLGEDEVSIWGDGTARREFLFVDDLARFSVAALERLSELPPFLNVGYGRDHTIREYYEMVAGIVGYQGRFATDAGKPAGMKRKLLDSSRACALGWKPETNIEDGIRRTYEYFLKQQEFTA